MDAYDADCLIFAASRGHPLGVRVAALLDAEPARARVYTGSTVLIPELLSKPIREERTAEISLLTFFLARLELHPVDRSVASLAAVLGARYRLRATDAIHLATAVALGADRFITTTAGTSIPNESSRSTSPIPTCCEGVAQRGVRFCPRVHTCAGAIAAAVGYTRTDARNLGAKGAA